MDTKITTYGFILSLAAVLVLSGIVLTNGKTNASNAYKYQCQNGQIVDSIELCPQFKCPDLNCSTCPKQIETNTLTKYQCYDGTVKDMLSECQAPAYSGNITEESIKLNATINSASDEIRYIHNPVLTLTNLGESSVTNLVFDVELYRSGKLISSESDVLYLSGSSSIKSIPAGGSTRGYLNLMIYAGNTNDFVPGTYILRVLVRKGADATPITTAEKSVSITA